ncbi:ead/Ea22-like family protein [Klebsiella pneumoniae]|nr:ead/Ea22-like family protein [Klebsiella pneumoniae]EKT9770303.1 ead/Ea22-like family protein [Klebsiella pneumoniae]EKU5330965.1 ead/Ea22-like family protein [Klebsiella pneumoniae]EKZ5356685.1 ead/Ea22-like family protein [Klebsiella pneumoniae]EKZ6112298.1 ead/Ea22-like family protein [Klebsiella pneumoniae]
MTTDITELAQGLKAAAENAIGAHERLAAYPYGEIIDISQHEGEQIDIDITDINEFHEEANPVNVLALVEALEKAQTINAAAEKLVRCKGRYHSEQNYRALAVLFGVKTPDLPPLEHENVHYADAAEMEIAALRQRIAELESQLKAAENNEIDARCHIADLESRTVKLPKPHAHLIWIQAGHAPDDYWDDVAVSHSEKDLCCDGSERYPVYARWEIEEMLAAAGIKVEAE